MRYSSLKLTIENRYEIWLGEISVLGLQTKWPQDIEQWFTINLLTNTNFSHCHDLIQISICLFDLKKMCILD